MGLDMYARTLRVKPQTPVDFKVGDDEYANDDLYYWRKHPDMHGWMENLYRSKGGTDESFNCVNVELTMEDLDALEKAINERNLPQTSGFFFGASDESDVVGDLEFITMARAALEAGEFVFYTSWW